MCGKWVDYGNDNFSPPPFITDTTQYSILFDLPSEKHFHLQLKQKDVTELLARADDIASQQKDYQEVYQAMAESLGEAWKDLNAQLEYRKLLLDQAIAFHQSANSVCTAKTFYICIPQRCI